jgi:hypothetical protein
MRENRSKPKLRNENETARHSKNLEGEINKNECKIDKEGKRERSANSKRRTRVDYDEHKLEIRKLPKGEIIDGVRV